MRLAVLTLALLLPLAAAAQDIDKVNGSVEVNAGEHAGNVHSVNGSVRIGDGAVVQEAGTVNGSVELGSRAQATSLDTVNGRITLHEGTRVGDGVKTVNGSISLDPHADVGGRAETVNGSITLDHAHIGGGIETVGGNITVGDSSRVEGGILVHEQHSHGWPNRPPHIVIGPHAVVSGTLEFHREVVLDVSDSAQIGPVQGAKANIFHGSMPD